MKNKWKLLDRAFLETSVEGGQIAAMRFSSCSLVLFLLFFFYKKMMAGASTGSLGHDATLKIETVLRMLFQKERWNLGP